MPDALLAENLHLRHGSFTALGGVSLRLAQGELLGVIGRSGSGKSTLGRLLCGLPPAGAVVSGTLRWPDGQAEVARARKAGLARHAAWLPQEAQASLHPMLRIGSQIGETLRAHGAAATPAAIDALLEQAGCDAALASRYPHQVSGGQAQRAALACVLAQNPRVLVADEPTSALDVVTEAAVLHTLTRLVRERRMALVLVTHDLPNAAALCHRVVVLEAGRIVEDGRAADMAAAPRSAAARRLAEAAGTLRVAQPAC